MLSPQATIGNHERERGIRFLLLDAAAATAIGAINSGVVLLALALHVGASNIAIGLLAAIPLLSQVLQAPAVKLVEQIRRRRQISVWCVFLARLALPIYACVPFIRDGNLASAVLIAAAVLHYGLNAVGACSWNSWIRDLIPPERLAQFFSRRGVYGTAVSMIATLAGAAALEVAGRYQALGDRIFSGLYVAGFCLGLISTAALAQVPDPVMSTRGATAPLHRLLRQPLRDRNFRNVLRFLASWQFAVNLATPFFTVYFVRVLGFSMGFVLLLTVISQLANIAVVQGWGRLSDRFANKSVLAVAAPMFILSIAGMAFASEFVTQPVRAGYLVILHLIMGAAGAGVGLASGNIVMKLSPGDSATSYLATSSLIGALAAGTAPIVGGWATDFFARRRLELHLDWIGPKGSDQLLGLAFSHWEFFFLLSALLGLYSLHRLAVVEEQGSVRGQQVMEHIVTSARRTLRNASTVAGLRMAVPFPSAELIRSREHKPFFLEAMFEAIGSRRSGSASEKAVGGLLGAAFQEPAGDGAFDDLLSRLDAIPAPPPAASIPDPGRQP